MDFRAAPLRTPKWLLLLVASGLLGSLAGVYVVQAPTSLGYTLDRDTVTVEASLGVLDQGRAIPRDSVREARAVALVGGRRVAGTGLPGYCQGRWRYAELGTVWQATDCGQDAVLLDTADGLVVLTPADREGFLAALRSAGSGRFDARVAPSGRPAWLLLVALVGLLPIVILPVIFLRLSRPMVYRVADGVLTVPAFFAPVKVRLAGTRVERGPLGAAWKVAGSGWPGFALGHFRKEGRGLHAAATRTDDGVWVLGDRTVFVSPEDASAFVAAIEREAG